MPPATPPPLLPARESAPRHPFLVILLSLVLGGFLGCAALSLLSGSVALLLNRSEIPLTDGPRLLMMLFITVLTWGLLAFFPAIPKRVAIRFAF